MWGVICSDYPKIKKRTYANTALGFPVTRQSTVAMREGGNVENITQNVITVHSRSLVVVVVSTVVQRSYRTVCFMGCSPGDVSEEPVT